MASYRILISASSVLLPCGDSIRAVGRRHIVRLIAPLLRLLGGISLMPPFIDVVPCGVRKSAFQAMLAWSSQHSSFGVATRVTNAEADACSRSVVATWRMIKGM